MNRQRWELSAACALLTAMAFLFTRMPAVAITVTDNFNADAQYAFGSVGGIWTGSFNMENLNGGVFNANLSNPGVLTVEDNGTFDNDSDPGNGTTGTGWEGGESTSAFLFTDVPAGQDFTATVKIAAQTSGAWSAAGIVARAANSPTPPGVGANNADENFVTAYSFRTNAGIPDVGTTLQKRIENGAQVNDTQINVNNPTTVPNPAPPPDTVSVPLNPLPTYVRLERVGGGTAYRTWVSSNGSDWQFQSRVLPTAGNALRDAAVPMQVGLAYTTFGTLAGTTQFDDFNLETYEPQLAPGAPSLSASETVFTVARGTELEQLITNSTTGQGPLSWVRTPNLPGTDAMLPGAQGGPASPLVPLPPENGSYFRWDTSTATNGVYTVMITATNDWGQASDPLTLSITIIPEPATLALTAIPLMAFVGWIRRRR